MSTADIINGGAIINAMVFTGGSSLYDKFGWTDESEERLRHDKAIEDLQNASSEWN